MDNVININTGLPYTQETPDQVMPDIARMAGCQMADITYKTPQKKRVVFDYTTNDPAVAFFKFNESMAAFLMANAALNKATDLFRQAYQDMECAIDIMRRNQDGAA